MKKPTTNFIVDCVGFIALLSLATTGYINRYILPPGTGGRGKGGVPKETLLSLGRHDWGDIHFYLALTFAAAMILHIYLHWNWIVNYCKTHFGKSA
jgi:hypothetical protein